MTTADFFIYCPAFKTTDATRLATITQYLADATTDCLAAKWLTLRTRAIAFLAGHRLAMADRAADSGRGARGSVTSDAIRGVSRSYGSTWPKAGKDEDEFLSTPWGVLYLELRAQIGPAVAVV